MPGGSKGVWCCPTATVPIAPTRRFASGSKTIPNPSVSVPGSISRQRYYDFFEQNKEEVFRLLVLGATNDDLERLSNLDSLIRLSLPVCKVDDFRPLTRLKSLRDLGVANPNLDQFKEERLLAQMPSLSELTLYNVADLQAALDLPRLEPRLPPEAPRGKGLVTLRVHCAGWNPRDRIPWPEKLERLPNLCVLTDRIWFAYLQGRRAEVIMSRSAEDDPSLGGTLLKDLIEKSGFFENLRDAPLEWIYYVEKSPAPSDQTVELLSKHPTLQRVVKNIESATNEVLWERKR